MELRFNMFVFPQLLLGSFSIAVGSVTRPYLNLTLAEEAELKEIRILSPVPISGPWKGGQTFQLVGMLAEDILNSQQAVIPGYRLKTDWMDDTCNSNYAVKMSLSNVYNNPYVFLGAHGCSGDCMQMAPVASAVRIPFGSYCCASVALSDPITFPDMVRFAGSEGAYWNAYAALARKYKWTHISVMSGLPRRWDATASHFVKNLRDVANFEATRVGPDSRTPSFEDCVAVMRDMKQKAYRVIVLVQYPPVMAMMACAAKHVGMPKGIVWLTHAGNPPVDFHIHGKGLEEHDPSCTAEALQELWEGEIAVGDNGKPAEADMDRELDCYPGYTPRSFHAMLDKHLGDGYLSQAYTFHGSMGITFDDNGDGFVEAVNLSGQAHKKGITTGQYYPALKSKILKIDNDTFSKQRLALAENSNLNYTVTVGLNIPTVVVGTFQATAVDGLCMWALTAKHMFGLGYSLDELKKPNETTYQEMVRFIHDDMSFFGALGRVDFTGPDYQATLAVSQMRNGERKKIATFDQGKEEFSFLDNQDFVWGDGETLPKDKFIDCEVGSVMGVSLSGKAVCVPCASNSYFDELVGECEPCPPGSYKNSPGGIGFTGNCIPCESGFFAAAKGSTSCQECEAGYSTEGSRGSAECVACPRGKFFDNVVSNEGADTDRLCKECPVGQYQSSPGTSDCKECAPTEKTLRLTNIDGKDQYVLIPGATSKDDCGCKPGTRLVQGKCETCGEGLDCRGKDEILTQPGYWSSMSDPLYIFRCDSEKKCAGGKPESCAGGRAGFLCARCPAYEKLEDDHCKECKGTDALIFVIFVVVLFVACPVVLYKVFNAPHRWKLLAQENTVLNTEVLVEMAQVMAVVAACDIDWGGLVTTLMKIFELFSVDIADFVSFQCLFNHDLDIKLYLPGSLMIPALCCDIWFVYFLTQMLPSKFRMYRPFVYNLCGKVLNTLYVSQVQIGMIPFVCYKHPNGEDSSISAFEATQCYKGDWWGMAFTGLFSLLISLLYFGYLCFEMRRAPRKLSDDNRKVYMQYITFLIEDFRADVYYWNIPAKIQEIALALVFVISGGGTLEQSILLSYILLVCLGAYSRFWPYKSPLMNLVVNLTFAILVAVLVCADARVGIPEEDDLAEGHMTVIVLISVLSFASIYILGFANVVVRGRHGELFPIVILAQKQPDREAIAKSWVAMGKINENAMIEYLNHLQIYDVRAIERLIPLVSALTGEDVTVDKASSQTSKQSKESNHRHSTSSNQSAKDRSIAMYKSDEINVENLRVDSNTDKELHQYSNPTATSSDQKEHTDPTSDNAALEADGRRSVVL